MTVANTPYVQERAGTLYVGDTRVTLTSLVAAWKHEGYTAEELQLGFPALSLAQVYGAIAYYLDHRAEVDQQIQADEEYYHEQRAHDRATDPDFLRQLDARRLQLHQR